MEYCCKEFSWHVKDRHVFHLENHPTYWQTFISGCIIVGQKIEIRCENRFLLDLFYCPLCKKKLRGTKK
jgi:hypothetical protein